jgi:hypothetical protein
LFSETIVIAPPGDLKKGEFTAAAAAAADAAAAAAAAADAAADAAAAAAVFVSISFLQGQPKFRFVLSVLRYHPQRFSQPLQYLPPPMLRVTFTCSCVWRLIMEVFTMSEFR